MGGGDIQGSGPVFRIVKFHYLGFYFTVVLNRYLRRKEFLWRLPVFVLI